jgi:hypothetical protein
MTPSHTQKDRRARGLGKPETFDFLGLTHYCATRRDSSGFVFGRGPIRKRTRAKLREIKNHLVATRHGVSMPKGAGSPRGCVDGSPTTPSR